METSRSLHGGVGVPGHHRQDGVGLPLTLGAAAAAAARLAVQRLQALPEVDRDRVAAVAGKVAIA